MQATQRTNDDRRPARYEIRVRGPIGETLMLAFPTLTATRHEHDTVLAGPLADQCALYGAIHQLETLGLQLLEVRQLPTGDPGPDPRAQDAR